MKTTDGQRGKGHATLPNRRYWYRGLRLLWEVGPAHMVSVLVVTIAMAAIPAVGVYLTTVAVSAVSVAITAGGAQPFMDQAVTAGMLLAGLALVTHLFTVGQTHLSTLLQFRMANSAGERIMAKAIRLQLEHFENPETYNALQLANREASYRPYQIFNDLTATVTSFVALASVSAVLLTWDVWVAFAVILAPVPTVLSSVVFGRIGFRIENDRAADRRRGAYLQYLVTTDRTYKETRLFGLGDFFLDRYRDLIRGFYRVDRSLERRQSLVSGLLGILSVAGAALAILMAVRSSIEVGDVGKFAGYVAAISIVQTAAQQLFTRFSALYEHNLFLGNLFRFLDLPESVPTSGNRPFPAKLRKGIEMRNITFTYPGSAQPVFDNLSIMLPAGKCVALVGQNGAGKTTLVKLLSRLYEPDSGLILIDDVPLTEYRIEDLHANIGIIFQDFVRYEASANDNIGYGRLDSLDDVERVRRAAADAGILGFLEGLPGGMGTQLGRWFEGGRQLSGGQWQKVALARAFLRDAPVVVLDEPTASIDAAAEAEIFSQLTDIARDSTTLLIAHRFSTVRLADHIIVIDDGRVLEQGDHTTLMRNEGLYAKLFGLQAAGYLDEVRP